MLKGIDPLLTADVLHALASAGHGDRIAIVDANFPATRVASRLVRMPGVSASRMLEAVLSVLPLDDFEPDPAIVMQVVGDPEAMPEPVREFAAVLARHAAGPPAGIERHAFYDAASGAFVVIQTGERRFYGNVLLTKGVISAPIVETDQATRPTS